MSAYAHQMEREYSTQSLSSSRGGSGMQHLIFVWVIFWFIHYHEKELVNLAHAKNWVWWLVYTSGVSPWKWEPIDIGFHLKMSDTCFQICFGYFKSLENQKNRRKIFCHECRVCQMGLFWVICYKNWIHWAGHASIYKYSISSGMPVVADIGELLIYTVFDKQRIILY